MGDPVKVQVEGKKRNAIIESQWVLLKKLRKAHVNSHTLMETCCKSFTHKIQVHRFFFPIINSSLKTKYYVSPYKSLHTWFPLISICVILFLDIRMQVGGRVRESPKTGDPVRATKTVCCTIRISLNYRGHGDPLKNYQYS
jgi:hypothetical protein